MFEGIREFIKGKKPKLSELATTESALYKGLSFDAFNPDLLARRKGGLRIYDQMRIDDQVKNSLALKKLATLAPGWTIEPASDDELDKEIAEFVKFNFADMKGTVHGFLKRLLTALDFGYSITEINWKVYKGGDFKGKIGIDSLKAKRPHFYTFDLDEFSNIKPDGLIQRLVNIGHGPLRLPINKFILYTYREEFGNWYGISDLREAYRSWWSKDNIIKFWNIFLERFGMPLILGKYQSADPTAKTNLLTLIESIQSKTSVVFREGDYTIEFLEAMRRGGKAEYERALDYYNRSISRSLLIPDRLAAAGETGAFAQSKTHFEIFLWVVGELRMEIEEGPMQEQLIRRLVDWNWPDVVHLPKFKFNPLTEEQKQELAKLFNDAVQKGAVSVLPEDEVHIREVLSFPEVDVEELKKRREEDRVDDIEKRRTDIEVARAGAGAKAKGEEGKPGEESEGKKAMSFIHEGPIRYPRELTIYEQRVDFVAVETVFREREQQTLAAMQEVLTRQRDALTAFVASKQVNGKLTTSLVKTGVTLKFLADLKREVVNLYNLAYADGVKDGKSELPARFATARQGIKLPAKDALRFLEAKADFVVRGIKEPLVTATQSTLLNAIKTGESVSVTVKRLQDQYIPYLADGSVIVDEKQLTAYRLEAITRTSQSEAYAQGRYAVAEDPSLEGFVIGYQFSEILDDRTVEVSRFVDGKIIAVNNPAVGQLQYPLHWNERGMPVYVTQDDGTVTFMSDLDISTAISMKGI